MLAPFLGGASMNPSFQRGLSRAKRGRLGWFKGLQRNKKSHTRPTPGVAFL
jgi:hypothetical protein